MSNRKQVAEMAGVSVAAVSRVLNNSGYVSQEKRERIQKAIHALDYEPNPIAVSLKRNSTRQLLFYIRDLSNNYFIELYKGTLEYATKNGYMFIISGGFDPQQIKTLMVDGVLLPSEDISEWSSIAKLKVPVVAATVGGKTREGIVHVVADVRHAMNLAIGHLRAMGHSRIGFLAMNRHIAEEPRYAAYAEALGPIFGASTIDYILGPSVDSGSSSEINYFENGIAAAREFIEKRLDASSFVSFNDDTAIGFISYVQSKGIRVPDDISIIGIDGHSRGAYTSPPLTTVSISPHAVGAECARLLIGLVEGREEVVPGQIKVELIERASVRRL